MRNPESSIVGRDKARRKRNLTITVNGKKYRYENISKLWLSRDNIIAHYLLNVPEEPILKVDVGSVTVLKM